MGYYTDPSSGLIYVRARWYDPATGRWLSRDPIGFGGGDWSNLYRYMENYPLMQTERGKSKFMHWPKELTDGLTRALEMSTLLGFEADIPASEIVLTFRVFTLPEGESCPQERRVLLALAPVGRIAACLQHHTWGNEKAAIVPFPVEDLNDVVRSFQGCDSSGWEPFDGSDENLNRWADRLSLDWGNPGVACLHTLGWFHQVSVPLYEGAGDRPNRHLYLRLWFGDVTIYSPAKTAVPVDAFVADAGRAHDWMGSVSVRDGIGSDPPP